MRISIKYNDLYGNDGLELASSSEPIIIPTSTSNDVENSQENSSLDEIYANLLRIGIKYNDLYGNDGIELTSSSITTINYDPTSNDIENSQENSSLDDIYENLLRISIKYNDLFSNSA